MCPIDPSRLHALRDVLRHGEGVPQEQLDAVAEELRASRDVLGQGGFAEVLPLYNAEGVPLGTMAPRWMCHLLGLRHPCVHVLLVWHSAAMGDVLVLQVRAWDKSDSPGRVDISVGGHMTASDPGAAERTVFAEMLDELGFDEADLEGGLLDVGGYAFDAAKPTKNFYNSEWRLPYIARVRQDRLTKLHFPDGEVGAALLVPAAQAHALLEQERIPMASGLTESLPRCLARLRSS